MSDPLNLKYVYSFQRERFNWYWNKSLEYRNGLASRVIKNAWLLPALRQRYQFGEGGVLDDDFRPVPESWVKRANLIMFGGAYDPINVMKEINCELIEIEEAIYLGFLYNHWGHLICDCSNRLWYAIANPQVKCVFLSFLRERPQYYSNIIRFLELCGISGDRLVIADTPVRAGVLHVPEQSYMAGTYYTKEYIDTFATISGNISSCINNISEKIYFSRSRYSNKELGNDSIDSLMLRADYEKYYPEEMTVDDQITLLQRCTHYACIQGSLVHNAIFCRLGVNLTIVNKTYHMSDLIMDSAKMAQTTPLFCDFYSTKYPVRMDAGPFLLCYNEFMQLFADDNGIDLSDSKLLTNQGAITSWENYEPVHNERQRRIRCNSFFALDWRDPNYYPLNFLNNWLAVVLPRLPSSSHGSLSIIDKNTNNARSIIHMKSVSAQRINTLGEAKNYSSYLEIGVCKGETFTEVNIKNKVGVDPDFRFDVNCYADNQEINLFKMTSDTFFSYLAKNEYPCSIKVPFDIIYIDGLHTFKQSLNDFMNTITYSHMNTIWIFDDTVPMDPYTALPDQGKAGLYRKMAGLKVGPWHGDVFKSIFAIHDFFPYFSYATVIDNGNPQTIVWRTVLPAQRKPLYLSRNEIENMSYFDMLENCALLNPVNDADLLSEIGTTFNMPPTSSSEYLAAILHKLWLA